MRKIVMAMVYILGIVPFVIISIPAVLIVVGLLHGWAGYHAEPDHIPCVWWHKFTGDMANKVEAK
jgi:hypothetical protein